MLSIMPANVILAFAEMNGESRGDNRFKELSLEELAEVLACLACGTPLVGAADSSDGRRADRFCPYTAGASTTSRKAEERTAMNLPKCKGSGHFVAFDMRDHLGMRVYFGVKVFF
jgi:hypothetical protein